MSQRSVCNQFTPQLWRATKCKFCFNDKMSHETASKENSPSVNIPLSSPSPLSPKPIKRLSSSFLRSEENKNTNNRKNLTSNSDTDTTISTILSSDSNSYKNRPGRIKMPTSEEKEKEARLSLGSPIQIDNISLRLEMNKQLLAKDDTIHSLEIRNQNLENEIRTLKDQNAQMTLTQRSEDEHRKLLDKIASLRRKLSDLEAKHQKIKEEKEDVEEKLKTEEQLVSKLKIKINSMEHEHYLLELRVEREQKHKQSMMQEKEDTELELESLRKSYRSMQRESRKFSTSVFDVDEERTRELEDQLRQTQRRLGLVEVENNRLKDKINKVENERQGSEISSLKQQLGNAKGNYEESVSELVELRASHLSEIQTLQMQISRLQTENDDLNEAVTVSDLEIQQMRRELVDADNKNSDNLSKDEELETLRFEVSRLQDKCSALCDVELIHINLNKELDRHRERADRAEQVVRQLERDMEDATLERDKHLAEVQELRSKEEECRRKHQTTSPPPIRSRAQSLEPTILSSIPTSGVLKKNREPAERDNDQLSNLPQTGTSRFCRPAPPANRRRPSRDHLHNRANSHFKTDSDI